MATATLSTTSTLLLSLISSSSSSTSSSYSALQSSSTTQPLPAPTLLTVILQSRIDGVSDFYPFEDIARLGTHSDEDFTFKELFNTGIEGGPEIVLFDSGCIVDGVADCTRACSDTNVFFGSLETFYNCAALASVAYWTQDARSYYVGDETERNASSIMGSGTLAGFNGKAVLNSFIACAKDSCDHDGLGEPCDHAIDRLSNETSTAEEIFDAMDTFCPDLAAEINPDIFGPGVLISYVLQVSFAAMLYLLLKGFTLWVRITQGSKPKPKPKPKPQALKRSLTRIESMIWRDTGAMSRTSIAIATTLVEFQEAQCWFVFAVQIASILAIVVNSQEGSFWGEIIVNAAIAYHVSQNGVLPMFLIQVCLHNEGIRNWHTFLGFMIEYILAIVATTQKIYFKNAFDLFRDQKQIKACGFNPSPRTYCAATRSIEGSGISFFPHPLLYKMVFLILDTISIIMLVFDQLTWTLREHRRAKGIQVGRYQVGRWPGVKAKRLGLRIKRGIWSVLEVAYLIINLLYMVSLIKVINAESFAGNKWSYGQIIAVTVWGPVIVKLFDLILSGPPKNGRRLNSGPPRLRIDNVLNRREGTSADEELLDEDEKYDVETAEIEETIIRDDGDLVPGDGPEDRPNEASGAGKMAEDDIRWKRKQDEIQIR